MLNVRCFKNVEGLPKLELPLENTLAAAAIAARCAAKLYPVDAIIENPEASCPCRVFSLFLHFARRF